MARGDGDELVECGLGHTHWGRFGAAGLLPVCDGQVLLQQRGWWTPGGNTWGLFGGARDSDEDAVAAALRETAEESTLDVSLARPFGVVREDHGGWVYETVIAAMTSTPEVGPANEETDAAAWMPVDEVAGRALFGPFAAAWPRLTGCLREPVLVVDCANVMGSRPDGWWRDRAGAAVRIRDSLARVRGFTGFAPFDVAYPRVVLVTEGQTRRTEPVDGVEVVPAPGSGDDTIVEVAAGFADQACLVVTADRELRARCAAVGADVIGPSWLLDQFGR
ncbi:NUDIX domain-containing protein [Actinokineospora sp. NBRC 105648]|uniref:NUDIX domain-containing protein n=1 Tax=Actinokineospora sp. NBRC 105648 TaxID=3032206 RepID=UPI0024A457D0|nr:NUDIX domain-containing protein [Actinokineospora sp. NBRC 105648]GLZ39538.1 NTP pyrophosphohydrolase [Actinokineospora sp. NBRC 105648]